MKKLFFALMLSLMATGAMAEQYSYPIYPTAAGGGGSATPGGTVTGANQYRSASGTFAGDDNIVDDGTGGLTLVQVKAGNGSAAAPSYTFANSLTSGWYRAGNNQLSLSLNGKEMIRTAQNSIGIGVSGTAPSATLQVSTICASGNCAGDGMFGGKMTVNTGPTGGSMSVAGITGLHVVSGTTKLGPCTTALACGVSETGALCFRSTNTSYYYCDGAGSWSPLTVGTKVSTSALN